MKHTRHIVSVAFAVLAGATMATSDRITAVAGTADSLAELKARFRRPERIPFPKTNPFSEAKYQLGKRLFFDPRLSRSGVMSCGTCHNPSFSWTDGLPVGVGHGHRRLERKVPSLLNVAWGKSFFWDGRAATLEEQALGPIASPAEMNLPLDKLVDRLRNIGEYGPLFEAAFPGEEVTAQAAARAIATYERTIVSDIAPFDRWIEGDAQAISPEAQRGFLVFNDRGRCVQCHTGWNFTNGVFADIGLRTRDRGREKIAKNRYLAFAFKAPTLRNITRRAPYMHDGTLATLADVIANYDAGGTVKRETARLHLKPLNLSRREKDDLVAFLGTLSSEDEAVSLPSLSRREEGVGEAWERRISSR